MKYNENLKRYFFSNEFQSLRIKIGKFFLEDLVASNLFLNNNLITFSYDKNNAHKEIMLTLKLRENLIFLENINNKNKNFLPLDKNIKFYSFYIKDELINIDLASKIIFDD